MTNKEKLYITQEDLFRVGNLSSPRLTNIRPNEINIIDINGIKMVVANGKGVSLYNQNGLEKSALTGWVWEIKQGSALPFGLTLREGKGGHYLLCPSHNMPLNAYAGLLEKMALTCSKTYKKKA